MDLVVGLEVESFLDAEYAKRRGRKERVSSSSEGKECATRSLEEGRWDEPGVTSDGRDVDHAVSELDEGTSAEPTGRTKKAGKGVSSTRREESSSSTSQPALTLNEFEGRGGLTA